MSNKSKLSWGPLFLVSASAVGFEIQLTRFFALASWAEYGYWVISIAMAGFAASGVVLSLYQDRWLRAPERALFWIAALLAPAAGLGYGLATLIPFNPMELQNPDLVQTQLGWVLLYYVVLFPFYFLAGSFVGLSFLAFKEDIPRLYAADLVGAGVGSLALAALMVAVHPFHLVTLLMLPLFAAAALAAPAAGFRNPGRLRALALALALVGAAIGWGRASFSEYKAIYAPLHVAGSRVVERRLSPRGDYWLLDDFTERPDLDLSNNFATLKVPGPPRALGLYQDGNRLTALPLPGPLDTRYLEAALDLLPYRLRPGGNVLILGSRGGFKIREAAQAGAQDVTAAESDPMLRDWILERKQSWEPSIPYRLLSLAPVAALKAAPKPLRLLDVSGEFLNQGDIPKYAYTREFLTEALGNLEPGGLVSLSVSIQEFPVYALKLLETARQALVSAGSRDPASQILLYRSAWNVRILLSPRPFSDSDVAAARAFCDQRSFDLSLAPGAPPKAANVWNDLPPFTLESGVQGADDDDDPGGGQDALRDDGLKILSDRDRPAFLDRHFFDLRPSTLDRPSFHDVLRPSRIREVLPRLNLLPREEIAGLINWAVLAQSLPLALLVLALPLLGGRRFKGPGRLPVVVYFAGLGLGYLMLEIYLIEKAAYLLGDRTLAFALALTTLLVSSGVGSAWSGAVKARPRTVAAVSFGVATLWVGLSLLGGPRLLDPTLGWPLFARAVIVIAAAAPLGTALGFFFPLGLSGLGGDRAAWIPWAWALNGSFSVVSTPLANLVVHSKGYSVLLVAGWAMYVLVFIASRSLDRTA